MRGSKRGVTGVPPVLSFDGIGALTCAAKKNVRNVAARGAVRRNKTGSVRSGRVRLVASQRPAVTPGKVRRATD